MREGAFERSQVLSLNALSYGLIKEQSLAMVAFDQAMKIHRQQNRVRVDF